MKHLVLFLSALLLVLSPNLILSGERPDAEAPGKERPGKPYVYMESAGKTRVMEIYFPPNHDPAKSKVPGMILFHGGGGTKALHDNYLPVLWISRGALARGLSRMNRGLAPRG